MRHYSYLCVLIIRNPQVCVNRRGFGNGRLLKLLLDVHQSLLSIQLNVEAFDKLCGIVAIGKQ